MATGGGRGECIRGGRNATTAANDDDDDEDEDEDTFPPPPPGRRYRFLYRSLPKVQLITLTCGLIEGDVTIYCFFV